MTSRMGSVEHRYMNDAAFHQLVRVIEQVLENVDLTPSEVREAAMYACIRFEQFHPKTFRLTVEDAQRIKDRIAGG